MEKLPDNFEYNPEQGAGKIEKPKDDLENINVFARDEEVIETSLSPDQIHYVSEMKERFDKVFEDKQLNQKSLIMDKISNFVSKLRKKYGIDLCDYAAYHVISFSTMDHSEIKYVDFPGEDSVEKFIDEL
jgi:hypothetical protein